MEWCGVMGQERGLQAGGWWVSKLTHLGEQVPGQWLGDLQSCEAPGPAPVQVLSHTHPSPTATEVSFIAPAPCGLNGGMSLGIGTMYPGEVDR